MYIYIYRILINAIMIMNIMKILLMRFYENWSLKKKKLMIPKIQFNLMNGVNLVVGTKIIFPRQMVSLGNYLAISIHMMYLLYLLMTDKLMNNKFCIRNK